MGLICFEVDDSILQKKREVKDVVANRPIQFGEATKSIAERSTKVRSRAAAVQVSLSGFTCLGITVTPWPRPTVVPCEQGFGQVCGEARKIAWPMRKRTVAK